MVIIINEVSFPPEEAHKVGEAFIEWVQKHPPDPTLDKFLCIYATSNANGDILVVGVSEVKEGRVKDNMMIVTEQNLFLAQKIKGLKYNIKPVLSYQEAYKIIGMKPPEL